MLCESIVHILFCQIILFSSVSGEIIIQKYKFTQVEYNSIEWIGAIDSAM